MCESRGGTGGPDPPPPQENHVIWVSIEISICATPEKAGPPPPHLENVGPPLDPWKSIVFSVIKLLYPLCKL